MYDSNFGVVVHKGRSQSCQLQRPVIIAKNAQPQVNNHAHNLTDTRTNYDVKLVCARVWVQMMEHKGQRAVRHWSR